MVMGRDSHSNGRGFDSRRRILDGHFSHLFAVKIVKFFFKKDENKKRPGFLTAMLEAIANINHVSTIDLFC